MKQYMKTRPKLSRFSLLALCFLGQIYLPGLSQQSDSNKSDGFASKQTGVKGSASVVKSTDVGQELLLAPGIEQSQSLSPLSSLVSTGIDLRIEDSDLPLEGATAPKVKGLMIEVKNRTDRPVLFDGDQATAVIDSCRYTAAPLATVEKWRCRPPSFKNVLKSDLKATASATISIGAVQSIDDEKIDRQPIAQRYGCDEKRRQSELARFGQRVLFPGDSSEGVIYFPTDSSLKGALLTVPLNSFYNSNDRASKDTYSRQ
jgi:hypothetical protein